MEKFYKKDCFGRMITKEIAALVSMKFVYSKNFLLKHGSAPRHPAPKG